MTHKTRNFVIASLLILGAGVCTGLVAYYGFPTSAFTAGEGPDELSFLPANATVVTSLAGIGLDKTKVELIADPAARLNGHHITAQGGFGRMSIMLENNPLATNPKSSELTALSLVRLIEQQTRPLTI